MTDVIVPKLGLTITEVEVIAWLRDTGAHVITGEAIVLLNADKTEVEVEATTDGVLEVLIAPGETVAVGATLARIRGTSGPRGAVPAVAPPVVAAVVVAGSPPEPAATEAPGVPAVAERRASSPAARALASRRGVSLEDVVGSGPNGRIVERDVPEQRRTVMAVAAAQLERATEVRVHTVVDARSMLAELDRARALGIPSSPAHLVALALTRLSEASVGWAALQEVGSVVRPFGGDGATAFAIASAEPSDALVDALVVDASARRSSGSLPSGTSGASMVVTVGHPQDQVVAVAGGVAVRAQLTLAVAASADRWSADAVFEVVDRLTSSLETDVQW